MAGPPRRTHVAAIALLCLQQSAALYKPKSGHEMVECVCPPPDGAGAHDLAHCSAAPDGTEDPAACQFIVGAPQDRTSTGYDEAGERYGCEHPADSAEDAPDCVLGSTRDTVDLEWDAAFVNRLQKPAGTSAPSAASIELATQITAGKITLGVGIFKDVLPSPQQLGQFKQTGGAYPSTPTFEFEGESFPVISAMRSGGFPMCPNFWDTKGDACSPDGGPNENPFHMDGDGNPFVFFDAHTITPEASDEPEEEPDPAERSKVCDGEDAIGGPLNDKIGWSQSTPVERQQEFSYYKWPKNKVGSPLKGDPELHFCRRVQQRTNHACCNFMLDGDIQEEYEELTGGGYLRPHVFLQQYLCIPCHPMISCMIKEGEDILQIPYAFAKRIAEDMEEFDRTGLKIKTGELDPDSGPLRQDELYVPSQYFSNLVDEPDGECRCTAWDDCHCIREFLQATRPPGINGKKTHDLL